MSVHKRLEKLEAQTSDADSKWVIPIEVRILAKAVERHQARNDGREPPPYAQEEIEQLRRYDLEIAAGGGVVGQFRESLGWQSEEAHELLDDWERDAHRRLEQAKSLPPKRWCEVWGVVDN
jgi:hypothetical protein